MTQTGNPLTGTADLRAGGTLVIEVQATLTVINPDDKDVGKFTVMINTEPAQGFTVDAGKSITIPIDPPAQVTVTNTGSNGLGLKWT